MIRVWRILSHEYGGSCTRVWRILSHNYVWILSLDYEGSCHLSMDGSCHKHWNDKVVCKVGMKTHLKNWWFSLSIPSLMPFFLPVFILSLWVCLLFNLTFGVSVTFYFISVIMAPKNSGQFVSSFIVLMAGRTPVKFSFSGFWWHKKTHIIIIVVVVSNLVNSPPSPPHFLTTHTVSNKNITDFNELFWATDLSITGYRHFTGVLRLFGNYFFVKVDLWSKWSKKSKD